MGARRRQKHALCVGINHYGVAARDLHGSVNDARAWAEALRARDCQVTQLLDKKATRDNILTGLDALIDAGRPGDSLIFTFSGHGSWIVDDSADEPDGRDELLCPADLTDHRYLLDDDLGERFARKAAGVRLLVIVDACHAGTVTKGEPPAVAESAPPPLMRHLPPRFFARDPGGLTKASRLPVKRHPRHHALLLAACRDDQLSYETSEGGRYGGVFTRAALAALADRPATAEEWLREVRARMPSRRSKQTPQLFGAAADRSAPLGL